MGGRGGLGGGGSSHNSTIGARRIVISLDHVLQPRNLTGGIDIVSPVPRAGGHHGSAVLDIWADGRDEAARASRELLQGGFGQVRDERVCGQSVNRHHHGNRSIAHTPTGTRSGKRAL